MTSPLRFPLLLALAFVLAGFCFYGSAGHDDSHITFWASYTLDTFGEILNYNGDRVEQSSSLLLTLATALLAKLTPLDVVRAGYLLATASGALAILLTWQLSTRIEKEKWGQSKILPNPYSDPIFPKLAVLLLATSPAFLLWNTSGMESTLTAATVLWFILCWGDVLSGRSVVGRQSLTRAALATFALASVRPEMISLVAGLVFLVFLWKRFTRTRGDLPILLFYSTLLLCICVLVGWRYAYFHSPLPLPVYSKVSALSAAKLHQGVWYLLRNSVANPAFALGLLAALAFLSRTFHHRTDGTQVNHYLLLATFTLVSYTAFILLSGGDWMQAGRFLVPVLPLAAICSITELVRAVPQPPRLSLAVAAILAVNLLANVTTIRSESHGVPLWASYHIDSMHQQKYSLFEQLNQEHLRDMSVIDTLDSTITALQQKNHAPVTLLSGQSGMVFFYTAQKHFRAVHFYDNRGLTDKSLLKCTLVNDVPRSSQGLYFDLDGFFARQPALAEQCQIPQPDILYDINDLTRQLPQRMEAQGYTLLHFESGKMVSNSSLLPANTLPAANFVMVANGLLGDVGNPEPVTVRYNQMPLVSRW